MLVFREWENLSNTYRTSNRQTLFKSLNQRIERARDTLEKLGESALTMRPTLLRKVGYKP